MDKILANNEDDEDNITQSLEFDYTDISKTIDRCLILESKLMSRFSGLTKREYRAKFVELSPYCRLRTIEVGFANSNSDRLSGKKPS